MRTLMANSSQEKIHEVVRFDTSCFIRTSVLFDDREVAGVLYRISSLLLVGSTVLRRLHASQREERSNCPRVFT